jgi:hypothetical protein
LRSDPGAPKFPTPRIGFTRSNTTATLRVERNGDREAIILDVDGAPTISTRFIPASRGDEVQLCCFDVLAMDGDDLRAYRMLTFRHWF